MNIVSERSMEISATELMAMIRERYPVPLTNSGGYRKRGHPTISRMRTYINEETGALSIRWQETVEVDRIPQEGP